MIKIGNKVVFVTQNLFEGSKNMFVDFSHFTAFAADQVMMMRIAMNFVSYTSLTKIGGVDQTVPREQIKGAVDCRFVELRITLADALDDFLDGEMPFTFANDGENHFTLRR
jgi:hypothetical protein